MCVSVKIWLYINCFDTFKLHYKVLNFFFLLVAHRITLFTCITVILHLGAVTHALELVAQTRPHNMNEHHMYCIISPFQGACTQKVKPHFRVRSTDRDKETRSTRKGILSVFWGKPGMELCWFDWWCVWFKSPLEFFGLNNKSTFILRYTKPLFRLSWSSR